MNHKDVLITVVGIFILLVLGGLIIYPHRKAAGPKLPPMDNATRNGPGFPPPTGNPKTAPAKSTPPASASH